MPPEIFLFFIVLGGFLKKILTVNNTGQLCLGDEPFQYDLNRSAKIDLCLNEVHFLIEKVLDIRIRKK